VVRAASTDEVRPVLTGVLWSFAEGAVRLVATDSYRLALREVALKEGPSEGEMIVPGRALASDGGVALVSFFAVALNGFLAEAFCAVRARRQTARRGWAFLAAGRARRRMPRRGSR